jgi:hypothetical protein
VEMRREPEVGVEMLREPLGEEALSLELGGRQRILALRRRHAAARSV